MSAAQETPLQEGLTEVASFRISANEKRAVRLLASADADGRTESEVLRQFFDAAALCKAADELRAKLVA
jgi:hypothetical protein